MKRFKSSPGNNGRCENCGEGVSLHSHNGRRVCRKQVKEPSMKTIDITLASPAAALAVEKALHCYVERAAGHMNDPVIGRYALDAYDALQAIKAARLRAEGVCDPLVAGA